MVFVNGILIEGENEYGGGKSLVMTGVWICLVNFDSNRVGIRGRIWVKGVGECLSLSLKLCKLLSLLVLDDLP